LKSESTTGLLSDEISPAIICVVDLAGGIAVHGIAGNRNQYRGVQFCDGSPIALADHYRCNGLSRMYIADLDAIRCGAFQLASLKETIATFAGDEVILDLGWTGNVDPSTIKSIRSLSDLDPNIRFVAATETATTIDAIERLSEMVPPDRIVLGLDYRRGVPVHPTVSPDQWLAEATRCEIFGVLVLDVASVGTSSGIVTDAMCRQIAQNHRRLTIYSGGGVRCREDVDLLLQSGCQGCLVATALHA
jgi:phosphoribosylformimino-5-aminoimidazole carboxamide ribotide isomerase